MGRHAKVIDHGPQFTTEQFASVLQSENEWSPEYALAQAKAIAGNADTMTEWEWTMSAQEYWNEHPVPEDMEGPAFC